MWKILWSALISDKLKNNGKVYFNGKEKGRGKGCFIEGTFTTRNLAPNDIKQLVDEVNKITHKAFGIEKDLIGRVYEYFLKEFAVNATKEEGEFYTPHDVVQLIATMIEPFDGTLYER